MGFQNLSRGFVGCLKLLKTKPQKCRHHAKREGYISTQNVDLAFHQQMQRLCFFDKHKGRVIYSKCRPQSGSCFNFKMHACEAPSFNSNEAYELRVPTPSEFVSNARLAFLLLQIAINWVNFIYFLST